MVYLLHFAPAYKHARHYLGVTDDLDDRLRRHSRGTGARITQVALAAGVTLCLVRLWDGDRALERRLKRQKHAPRLCPLCRATDTLNV